MNKNNVILPVVLILAAALVVGGFVLLKNHKDKVAPTPVAVVEEPVVEEPEPVVEEPAPQPRRQRQRRDLNSSINTMNPMQGQNMPTREEAVNAARDILASYREASPQEKQQMAMVMNIAAGFMNGISQNAGQFIQQIKKDFNLTVFVIEHHMDLVMGISDRIYVIEFGKQIAEGTPEEIQNNQAVIDAYLGGNDE